MKDALTSCLEMVTGPEYLSNRQVKIPEALRTSNTAFMTFSLVIVSK